MKAPAGSTSPATTTDGRGHRLSRIVAIVAGVFFLITGLMAMASPKDFFESVATFNPYNQHFIQDIGAMQIGLGSVLLIASFVRHADGLTTALLGVGVGSAAHAASHIIGRDLGGEPATDIPMFVILAAVLLMAGVARARAR